MQFTLARVGTGIAVGNDMFSYMKGFTPTKWHSVQVLLAWSAYVVETASFY